MTTTTTTRKRMGQKRPLVRAMMVLSSTIIVVGVVVVVSSVPGVVAQPIQHPDDDTCPCFTPEEYHAILEAYPESACHFAPPYSSTTTVSTTTATTTLGDDEAAEHNRSRGDCGNNTYEEEEEESHHRHYYYDDDNNNGDDTDHRISISYMYDTATWLPSAIIQAVVSVTETARGELVEGGSCAMHTTHGASHSTHAVQPTQAQVSDYGEGRYAPAAFAHCVHIMQRHCQNSCAASLEIMETTNGHAGCGKMPFSATAAVATSSS
uniref:Uncharacterized protein n=1 Tax=Amphora coffeiformis TaxID=265554 RepID=A0A7S3L1C5_9STRA|eukprot:scaffold1221_cov207-Amphora_coffeaeformis.AAC.63